MATLKDTISIDCWDVIKDNYEKGSFTTAITNLIQYINEVCREITGLSLDNTKLMEKAFLGDKPSLLINKFETQTEKDTQWGIGYILKGVCLAIRNPRSHKRFSDDQKTATTIILFLDYILQFIKNSKQSLLIDDWAEIIFDINFSDNPNYAQELFNTMPNNKKLDILINVFRNCDKIQTSNVMPLMELIIDSLLEKERIEYFDMVSKYLIKSKDDEHLYKFFLIYPPKYWSNLSRIARIRVESMVKKSVKLGSYCSDYDHYGNPEDYYLKEGNLAISAIKHIPMFENKIELYEILGDILMGNDECKLDFLKDMKEIFYYDSDDILKCDVLVWGIEASISDKKTDEWIVDIVRRNIKWNKKESWVEKFEKTFDSVFKIKKFEPICEDDLPF